MQRLHRRSSRYVIVDDVGGMKTLAKQIERELREMEKETARIGHCAIYEDKLQRIWPLNSENRKTKIAQFAKEYGFKLSFYKEGLCAIFEKDSIGNKASRNRR